MSYGTICLACRRYISAQAGQWACRCQTPLPSDDGLTLNTMPPEEVTRLLEAGAVVQIMGQYYIAKRDA